MSLPERGTQWDGLPQQPHMAVQPGTPGGFSWKPGAAVTGGGVLLFLVGGFIGLMIVYLVSFVVMLIGVVMLIVSLATRNSAPRAAAAQPVAFTAQGQPVYQVVGYTPDGRPVTADQVVGYRPAVHGTNAMSVVALILGLMLPVLAIPFGHIAMGQIKRSGEQGRGLAIAGLILGYLGLVGIVAFGIIIVANS